MANNCEGFNVLGIGHNSITMIDLVRDCGFEITGLYHYNHDLECADYFGFPIAGCTYDLLAGDISGKRFLLSMGDLKLRRALFDQIRGSGGIFPSLIHPTAVVSRYCVYGEGLCVMPNCTIQADTRIGNDVVISINSTIAHSTRIGSHCFISGHSLVGAYTELGDCVQLGQFSCVVSGSDAVVGDNSILGAGSVLRGPMRANSIYVGNPARLVGKNDP